MAVNSREQVFFEDDGESFRKGVEFEKYTLKIFPAMHYDCLERTHDSKTNEERFIESSLKPDFKFRDKKTKREFSVESKYRGMLIENRILWTDAKQFQRYYDVIVCNGLRAGC